MRVLFINHTSIIGGAETNLLNILRFSDGANFEPVAVLLPGAGPLVSRLQAQDMWVEFVDYYGLRMTSPWRFCQTVGQLCRWVHRTKADIIHLNHEYLIEYAYWAGRLTHTPVICHVRNLASSSFIQRNRRYFAGVAQLVAISRVVEAHMLQHGTLADKISLIYDGIDVKRFEATETETAIRNEWATLVGAQVVGFVGRLVGWKGIEDLIRAAPMVLTVMPNIIFVVVGTDEEGGRYAQQLKTLTKTCGVDQAFRFVGFRRDVATVLHGMDIFVLPSHREPLGNVVLEAMAAGRLVVATDDGGAAELLQDKKTGFLTPSQQPAALAQAIVQALQLDAAKRECMITAAKLSVQMQFTIQRQVSQLGSLYQSMRWADG